MSSNEVISESVSSANDSIPKTGVESHKELWLAGSVLSLATALWLLLPNKKKQKTIK